MRSPFKILIAVLCCIALSGCLHLGGLNYKQARMLKKQGFELTTEGWTLALPERLLFGFNQADVKPQYSGEIRQLAQRLKKYHLDHLKIVGYTDDVGSAEYNLQLSKQRAENVAQLFLNQNYTRQDIAIIGRGAANPLLPNTTEENRASNRRVAIVIVP
jgi:outer membrane protein OmpA-like peptidoglycan-associated protein